MASGRLFRAGRDHGGRAADVPPARAVPDPLDILPRRGPVHLRVRNRREGESLAEDERHGCLMVLLWELLDLQRGLTDG